ncbi:MAG: nucleotidyltransferase family protein [Defluviitaleaceae bacterium]|nr:nucleotidyltransferase family protein [Defluviitaleaceae bacterium]
MRPSVEFNKKREAIRELVARSRLTNPRVFGSVLHGTDKEGSDLDLLVDARPGVTLFDLCRLEAELRELLGMEDVHLSTPKELAPFFREQVLAEARSV